MTKRKKLNLIFKMAVKNSTTKPFGTWNEWIEKEVQRVEDSKKRWGKSISRR